MLLGTRFTNVWRWWTSPTISTSHAFHFNARFLTSSQLETSSSSLLVDNVLSTTETDDVFLPWLERKSNTRISSVLSIGKSDIGRFLFASETIRAGDCILKVPFNVQISPDMLPSPIRDLLGDEIGNVAKVALVILLEQKLGSDSKWAPYIIRLPKPWEMHNTIFWSERELEMIRKSSLYEESLNQRSQIEREFLAIKQVSDLLQLIIFALETFPEIVDSINCDDFMHACALGMLILLRRKLLLEHGEAQRVTLWYSFIPFADFLNHDGASKSLVLNDDDKQLSEVIADRDYAPGEHVLIRYGKYSNATLMLDFGFALPYNIHDQVLVQIKTVEDDPLARRKLELWQRSCTSTTKYVNGIYFPGNSFTIRGLPQSLRAFARILSCTSPQELNDLCTEAANGDGRLARIPLKNLNREVEAHQILLSQFKQLVEEYEASIEVLAL
ncbi:Ribulose-1,5 bisphosphate carboxylase/oxygenase large subunit N-methyltransferase, chloroplastic [Cucurbita argyrosperma subsp. argyrosperma]|nr:Ribulose-1,5 bisphosphate carboxylase/oxygenase large subunit N-methyltransferase, chloroplastic [Cucurbita argyrosperma subsp. argyrosperma]